MVILQCTKKLQKQLNVKPVKTDEVSTNRMGDWSCNLIRIDDIQLILCVNHKTRFPIFIPAAPEEQFLLRLQNAVHTVLRELGVPPDLIEKEVTQYNDLIITATNDRSVLGSLIDYSRLISSETLSSDPLHLVRISLRLAETPCLPLDYQYPDQVARQLFVE